MVRVAHKLCNVLKGKEFRWIEIMHARPSLYAHLDMNARTVPKSTDETNGLLHTYLLLTSALKIGSKAAADR